MCFVWFSLKTGIIFLNSINQFIFVILQCCVFFTVRTELKHYLEELWLQRQSWIGKSLFRLLWSQAPTTFNRNVFTFIPLLSEGRVGIAWESSNNKTLFHSPSTKNKLSLTSPSPQFSFCFYFSSILPKFLSLQFERLINTTPHKLAQSISRGNFPERVVNIFPRASLNHTVTCTPSFLLIDCQGLFHWGEAPWTFI
jgi:hypothetical protein